jgi:Protein of unknown function (DUF2478)
MDRNGSRLAAIQYARGFDIDRLLIDVCARAASAGLRLGGLVQMTTGERGGNCAATIHVVDLRTQQSFDIWQDRGACAKGCRLNERGLADAEPVIMRAVKDRVELLIINRFGRAESLGRGLRPCFEAAMGADIPALTAVRAPYDEAWQNFHGGLGSRLPCDVAQVGSWIATNVAFVQELDRPRTASV